MSHNSSTDAHALEAVERWRLNRFFEEYAATVHTLLVRVPEPWVELLRAIPEAQTHHDVTVREFALVHAIRDTLEPTEPAQSWSDKNRAPCPLCGETTQQGEGFALPLGMERHLTGYRYKGCGVLQAAVRLGHMYVNERQGKRFYNPFVD